MPKRVNVLNRPPFAGTKQLMTDAEASLDHIRTCGVVDELNPGAQQIRRLGRTSDDRD